MSQTTQISVLVFHVCNVNFHFEIFSIEDKSHAFSQEPSDLSGLIQDDPLGLLQDIR
jgi:hypothetical protein